MLLKRKGECLILKTMKMIQKVALAIGLALIVCQTGYSQVKKSGFDKDKIVYGGNVMPYISNYGTFIAANPFVGYKVTDRFVPGIMLTYQYASYNNSPAVGYKQIYNLVGVSPFARYTVYKSFFAQAEYQFLNGSYELRPLGKENFSENNLFLGGGYVNQIPGSRGGLYTQVMYNVTWRGLAGNSVYSSPWVFRVGFTIF
jgi:hypothetical protein